MECEDLLMDKNISKGWLMFLNGIQPSIDKDQRQAYALIERDSIRKGLHDQTIRQMVESGYYGQIAKEMWDHF